MVGAVCYWIDMRHCIISKIQNFHKYSTDLLSTIINHISKLDDVSKVSLLFIALIVAFAVKIFTLKRQNIEDSEIADFVALDSDEKPSYLGEAVRSVPRISPGQYEWQAITYTRIQIEKLVNSKNYSNFTLERGPIVSAWNWKLKEIEMGILPPDEDTMAKHPIDLDIEISRADSEVRELRKFAKDS